MADFLLELRCEEIPARMQPKAKEDLARLFADALAKAKQMRFLQMRGFSFDIIRQVIAGSADFDADANTYADGDAQ